MRHQSVELLKLYAAPDADEPLLVRVDLHVFLHVGGGVDSFVAVGAAVLVDAAMLVHVVLETALALDLTLAYDALVRALHGTIGKA